MKNKIIFLLGLLMITGLLLDCAADPIYTCTSNNYAPTSPDTVFRISLCWDSDSGITDGQYEFSPSGTNGAFVTSGCGTNCQCMDFFAGTELEAGENTFSCSSTTKGINIPGANTIQYSTTTTTEATTTTTSSTTTTTTIPVAYTCTSNNYAPTSPETVFRISLCWDSGPGVSDGQYAFSPSGANGAFVTSGCNPNCQCMDFYAGFELTAGENTFSCSSTTKGINIPGANTIQYSTTTEQTTTSTTETTTTTEPTTTTTIPVAYTCTSNNYAPTSPETVFRISLCWDSGPGVSDGQYAFSPSGASGTFVTSGCNPNCQCMDFFAGTNLEAGENTFSCSSTTKGINIPGANTIQYSTTTTTTEPTTTTTTEPTTTTTIPVAYTCTSNNYAPTSPETVFRISLCWDAGPGITDGYYVFLPAAAGGTLVTSGCGTNCQCMDFFAGTELEDGENTFSCSSTTKGINIPGANTIQYSTTTTTTEPTTTEPTTSSTTTSTSTSTTQETTTTSTTTTTIPNAPEFSSAEGVLATLLLVPAFAYLAVRKER